MSLVKRVTLHLLHTTRRYQTSVHYNRFVSVQISPINKYDPMISPKHAKYIILHTA